MPGPGSTACCAAYPCLLIFSLSSPTLLSEPCCSLSGATHLSLVLQGEICDIDGTCVDAADDEIFKLTTKGGSLSVEREKVSSGFWNRGLQVLVGPHLLTAPQAHLGGAWPGVGPSGGEAASVTSLAQCSGCEGNYSAIVATCTQAVSALC